MKHFLRKLTAAAVSAAAAASLFSALPAAPASAASTYWKFDFGGNGAASGYTGVSASDGYNASRGWGFSSGTDVANVGASGQGALSDAVQFKNAAANGNYTFCADVPNGLYQVSVWLGNTTRTSIGIEKMLQIVNMTGNGAYHTLQVPVTDGQLNICACAGKEGYPFSIAALEIKQISAQTHTNPTIWVCGDSTVCNYYPLDSSAQAGWAQMLPQFIDTSQWQVMNQAASGQFARGFMEGGQFDVIETNGQPGDIYVISIGINDTNSKNNTTEAQYEEIITDMAKRAMAKGMRVILVKQQGRNGDCQRNPLLEYRWYAPALDRVGAALGIEVVDLFKLWQDYCLTKSADQVSAMYLDDGLHPNRAGATVLAQFMADAINSGMAAPEPVSFDDGSVFMFRNAESGMYLTVEDGKAEAGANVSQSSDAVPSEKNTWKLKAGSNGDYYIYSMLDGGGTYLLDVADAKTADGTNIGIWTDTGSNAQLFRFYQNGERYFIATAVTDGKSLVGISGGSHAENGNAIEWVRDGSLNQSWEFIPAAEAASSLPLAQADLDSDGAVSAKDLTLAKRAMRAEKQVYAAIQASDVNSDMQADAADAALLCGYLLTKETAFADPKIAASEQTITDGIHETTNAGYLYKDYVNLANNTQSALTFSVNVVQTGNYLCTFNIANGTTSDRDMTVTVSGSTDTWKQSFMPTGAWTTWKERGIVLPLKAGINTITLKSNTSDGGPNFDYLMLTLTDEPVAQPYDPTSQPEQPVSDNPVIYIASDSTAQNYKESNAPQQGWGFYLPNYFSSNVSVSNHSIAGRSSKSFYDNGRLTTILDQIKQGDYLLIDFGINDGDYSKSERYAPVCGNADNPQNGSFEYYMTFYIKGALDKGATPILMSPTLSIRNQTQPFKVGYRNIDSACKMLAGKYNIPYFDLGSAMTDDFNRRSYDTVKGYYMGGAVGGTDFTHFTTSGADVVAQIIANGIKGLNIELSKSVK